MRKLNKQFLANENSVEMYFCNCSCNCGSCVCACTCFLWQNSATRDSNTQSSNQSSVFGGTSFGARGGHF